MRKIIVIIFTGIMLVEGLANAQETPTTQDMDQLGQFMKIIKEKSEEMEAYQKQQKEIDQLRAMLRDTRWMIERNAAFIKDWQTNGDCMVAKRVVSLLSVDRDTLTQRRQKLATERSALDPEDTPALYDLYGKTIEDINHTLSGFEEIQNRLNAKCGNDSN